MKDLDRQSFLEFMSERGVDVEFDSDTPGFFNAEGKLIATIDEIFSGPPFLPICLDEEADSYSQSPIKELTANIKPNLKDGTENDNESTPLLSYKRDNRQSGAYPSMAYQSMSAFEPIDDLNVRSAA
ncbi:hypothetical protein [Peptococcus simiae]|uniref:hypothetical protein n=1 Tax=Peptococcus simiae TaxID=1643805 RepID=UPI0039800A24